MADMESSGITTTCGSSSKVLSQELSDIGSEQQNHPVEGDSIVCEQGFGEGKECPASLVPVAATEGDDDDDVLFIFSAPRSKKQQRRRLESLHTMPVSNPPCEHPSYPPATSLDCPTRRGTTGMVQGLEGCHIEDTDVKPTNIRGTSLPIVPPVISDKLHNIQLPPIDPATEPNFVAMQDLLPDTSLQWWNEPESNYVPIQMNASLWTNFQDKPSSSEYTGEEGHSEGRIGSVDDQVSPRTKPATNFQGNNKVRDISVDSRSLEKRPDEAMIYQPPSYHSSRMPSWSRNWSAFSDANNKPFLRARMPSNTPLSVVRSAFRSNPQQKQPGQVHYRAVQYSPPYALYPQRFIQDHPSHTLQHYHESSSPASIDSNSHFRESRTPNGRNQDAFMSSSQRQNTPPAQSPGAIQDLSNFRNQELIRPQIRPDPPRIDNPNDVLRKPSLYKIPSWPAPNPQIPEVSSAIRSSGVHHHPQLMLPPNTTYRQNPTDVNMHMSSPPPPPPPYQPINDTEPSPARRRGARKFTPNLIVDIAETCQQLFPFAMIAERHSVPLQKVFDTFSAIIQLPLLRNADDKRRHGSLGKRRMRDFREAKKKMAEEMRGVKRSSDEMGGSSAGGGNGEKRVRRDQPLLRCAVMNNARDREGGGP